MINDPSILTDETASSASFVAVTRTVEGETQLLVEVQSLVHEGLYHPIGGKAEKGETSHDTVNRELGEECELEWPSDAGRPLPWKSLGKSDLLGRTYHPGYHEGKPIGLRSYYLYPDEVSEAWGKGVHTGWVPVKDLSALNSTSALQDLTALLRKRLGMDVFGGDGSTALSHEDIEKLRCIRNTSAPSATIDFIQRIAHRWEEEVDAIKVRVIFWWMDQGGEHLPAGVGVGSQKALGDVMSRISHSLDKCVTNEIKEILKGSASIVEGMNQIASLVRNTQSLLYPSFSQSGPDAQAVVAFDFNGLGLSGIVGTSRRGRSVQDLVWLPLGLVEGLEVLLEALGGPRSVS